MKVVDLKKRNTEEVKQSLKVVCDALSKNGISRDYVNFIFNYRFDFLEQLSFHLPFRRGLFVEWRFIDVLMLYDPRNISKYEVDFGEGERVDLDLYHIGDNNIPEGGIFISTGAGDSGVIYSFLNEPDRATDDEIIKVGESFSDFINKIRIYDDLGMQDKGSFTLTVLNEIDVELADYRDQFFFPWEMT